MNDHKWLIYSFEILIAKIFAKWSLKPFFSNSAREHHDFFQVKSILIRGQYNVS